MKNIYKNLVSGGFLGAIMLLGATACSDDHFDVQEQPGALNGQTTIWDCIDANPELSQVKALLKSTRVMKDDKDDKAQLTYAEWLNQPMEVTAWLPKDGTFDSIYHVYTELLDSAAVLKANGDKVKGLRLEYRVVNQFVKNHIALFNFSTTEPDLRVRLLNSKRCLFDGRSNKFSNATIDPSLTQRTSNGSLYVLNGAANYANNIFDFMSSDANFSTVYDIISNPNIDKNVFWPEASTQGAVNEKGEIVYVDSVYRNTNELLNRANAQIKSEDSVYVAFIPSNKAWNETFKAVQPMFKYGSSYCYDWVDSKFAKEFGDALTFNVDSLSDLSTSATIIESMFFNPSAFRKDGAIIDKNDSAAVIDYMLYADSLISTNNVVFYNKNKGGINPMFEGLKPIKASNGYVFAPDNNRIDPTYSYVRRQEVRPGSILAYLGGAESAKLIKLTSKNWQKDSVCGSVDDDSYHYFYMYSNNVLRIRMHMKNLPCGHYKISAQMLPNRVNKDNVRRDAKTGNIIIEKPRFDAKIFLDNDLYKPILKNKKYFTVNQDSIQNVVLFEDFHLQKSYMNLPAGYVTFPLLEISMDSDQKRMGKCHALSIAKIVIEPIRK